ncbi:MAG: DUF4760 domain-containing protein [bacterium]
MSAEWAAAAFAGIAAAVAIVQVRIQIVSERRQAAFAHIRQLTDILHSARQFDPRTVRQETLGFYAGSVDQLSPGAQHYLAFHDALEQLALAYAVDAVDRGLVRQYVADLVKNPYTISEAFIREFRKAARDDTLYEHLLALTETVRSSK